MLTENGVIIKVPLFKKGEEGEFLNMFRYQETPQNQKQVPK